MLQVKNNLHGRVQYKTRLIESENRLKNYCNYDHAKEFLTKNKINGLKYNYSMDDSVQNFNNYQC